MPDNQTPPTEEEVNQKILRDSRVVRTAARGITSLAKGELTGTQVRALIECDDWWLDKVGQITGDVAQ